MTDIYLILEELNLQNGSNHKLAVLKKHKNNDLLTRVLKLTYDKAAFTFGISMKNVSWHPASKKLDVTLEEALESLERDFATRNVTGNAALALLENLIAKSDLQQADLIRKIINRDLRINAGRTLINKVWPQLITKPAYMRCGIYTSKIAKDITFPAYIQLKADGTYREFSVTNGAVECVSRSGEEYEYPMISAALATAPDGHYFGELVVSLTEENLPILKEMYFTQAEELQKLWDRGIRLLPRAISNGIINSLAHQ